MGLRDRIRLPLALALLLALAAGAGLAQEPKEGRKAKKSRQIAELTAALAQAERLVGEQERQIAELSAALAEAEAQLATAQEAIQVAERRQTELEGQLAARVEKEPEKMQVRSPMDWPAEVEEPPAASPGTRRVSGRARPCLKLRTGPSFEATAGDCLPPATRVRVLARDDPWANVEIVDSGLTGWLADSYLEDDPEPEESLLRERLKELQARLATVEREREEALRQLAARNRDPSAPRAGEEAQLEPVARPETTGGEDPQAAPGAAGQAGAELGARPQTEDVGGSPRRREPALVAVRQPLSEPEPRPEEATREPVGDPTAAAPAPAAPSMEDATATVEAWAAAWAEQRVGDYLSVYAATFRPPPGLSRRDWEDQRRRRLTEPEHISVTLRSVRLLPIEPDRVQVSFRQDYSSDRFSDTVEKVLTLIVENGGWKILAEEVTQ